MNSYRFILHPDAYQATETYRTSLAADANVEPGHHLQRVLVGQDVSHLDTAEFLECLVNTKPPQIFAESSVRGDGSDWSPSELSLLGDISVAVPVTFFDDGKHYRPTLHPKPFKGWLIYTPGALLRCDRGCTPADWMAVTRHGQLDSALYCELYERRLLPVLMFANQQASNSGQKAFVTIPGLGCGQFAGPFIGQLGEQLKLALIKILKKHGHHLTHIKAVYFDPFKECENERLDLKGISLRIRPLMQGNQEKPQLCHPTQYQEAGDDFSDCTLFSLVAWDHVSWPGNDFYGGARATDDGVKAAATDSMTVMTSIEGRYNPATNQYEPPAPYRTWGELVQKNKLRLSLADRVLVLPPRGEDHG